jgi:hypothetical protein
MPFFAAMVEAVIRLVVSRKIRVHARSVDEEARGGLSFRGGLDILLMIRVGHGVPG